MESLLTFQKNLVFIIGRAKSEGKKNRGKTFCHSGEKNLNAVTSY